MRRVYLLGFIWGWSFFLVKKSLPGFTPWTVASGRILLGALTLAVIVRVRGVSLPRERRLWFRFAVIALVSSAIPLAAQSIAQAHIPSTLTAVLNATTPLFTGLIVALVLRDRLRSTQVAGLLLGFVGVVVAAGVSGEDLHGAALGGVLLMLLSTLCYGIGFAYTARKLNGISPLVIAFGQLWIGGLVLVPPAVATSAATSKSPTLTSVVALAVLGIVGTGLAWVINFKNVAEVGPANASAVTFLVPIVAFFLGIVLLHEPFLVRHLVGGVVTLLGVAMLQGRFDRFLHGPVQAI